MMSNEEGDLKNNEDCQGQASHFNSLHTIFFLSLRFNKKNGNDVLYRIGSGAYCYRINGNFVFFFSCLYKQGK
jgi:hypothetical protein